MKKTEGKHGKYKYLMASNMYDSCFSKSSYKSFGKV